MVPNLTVDQCVIDKERKISFLVGSVTAKDIKDVIHEKKRSLIQKDFVKSVMQLIRCVMEGVPHCDFATILPHTHRVIER